ncbi:MAG: Calx-beta domain-containing protein [Planctomycetota bacterium]
MLTSLFQKTGSGADSKPQKTAAHWRRRAFVTGLALEQLESRRCLAGLFSLEAVASTVQEGDAAVFKLRLSAASRLPESVLVSTVAETATLGLDYMARPVLIQFAPGETLKEFRLQTLADARPVIEGVETFRIYATPAGRPTTQQMSAQVRIRDFIPQAISTQNISLFEGNAGTSLATFTVRLSASAALPVTVAYATRDGSATVANSDYVATNGTLTFRPGETTKTVAVTVNGDTTLESDEVFSLDLTSPSRGATILTPTATCTILKDETDVPGFQIDLTFGAGVTPAVMTAARAAATRWQQIISSDVPGKTTAGVFVDDITINVQMGLLGNPAGTDGPGGALANAGPTAWRTNANGLPYQAEAGIDPADANSPGLTDTVTHEFGHALGFPDAKGFKLYVSGAFFTGSNALREFKIFAPTATGVPLETTGTAGTVGGHWLETVFGNELMTGFSDRGVNPISRITVGAFQDMGYTVNYNSADSYRMPGAAVAGRSTAAVVGTWIGLQSKYLALQAPANRSLAAISTTTQAKILPMQFAMIATAERTGPVAGRNPAPVRETSYRTDITPISTGVAGRTQSIALLSDYGPTAPRGY